MEILTTKKVEQTELVDQLDFAEEIKNWLLEKGYVRKVSEYGLKKVSYEKGALELEPCECLPKTICTVYIRTHTYLTNDNRTVNIKKGDLEYRDMESTFLNIENTLYQAQDDLREFYYQWLDYVEEKE